MRRSLVRVLVVVSAAILLAAGCAQVPIFRVWQPWTRTLGEPPALDAVAGIGVEVSGDTQALVGKGALLSDLLRDHLVVLLERRGFRVTSEGAPLTLKLSYQTVEGGLVTEYVGTATSQTTSFRYTSSSSDANLSVAVARAVAAAAVTVASSSTYRTDAVRVFTHCVALEAYRDGTLTWQGESRWDSRTVDARAEFPDALQLLVTALPRDEHRVPSITSILPSKTANFFELMVRDRWFTCPALPYRIRFERPGVAKAPQAFAAYLDLVQTAEDVLPRGTTSFAYPLSSYLWTRARLGGQYQLAPSATRINVLVDLSGTASGYVVQKCWVASPAEYAAFKKEQERWRVAVRDFYAYSEPATPR